jgi:hypothetical protein
LGLANVSITGRDYVGSFCGAIGYGSTITNCYATGTVTGEDSVGGFCGINRGSATSCYFNGSVSGLYVVGGFQGQGGGTATSCYSMGSVSGTGYGIGGFIGLNAGTISNCYSICSVSGGEEVGGFCGENYNYEDSLITSCFASGDVSSTDSISQIGGFCGYNDSLITNCYSEGNSTGITYVGGFCGSNLDTITNCYSVGSVSGTSYVGGFSGRNYFGHITSCYFLNTAGPDNSLGTPETADQLAEESTYIDWNFGTIWTMCIVPECIPILPYLRSFYE